MQSNLWELFWEGYKIDSWQELGEGALRIRLVATGDGACGGCGALAPQVHETQWRRVRDLDLLDRRLWLELPVRRVCCPRCGVKRERIAWLGEHQRLAHRLVRQVEALCRVLPIQHVARHLGLSWHTVKRIDKARLQRELPPLDYRSLRRLVMDEFALHKGHRYASVIADAETRQVLWIGEGRSREAVRPFFQELGAHCAQIEAVAMDQNSAFDLEVKAHCPNAEVVYDLFHIVAKYGREVIDRVRVDQANALREDKPARQAVKRSRWLLLRNRDNLSDDQATRLDALMSLNAPLAQVYILKDQLKELWRCPSPWSAYRLWRAWWRMAQQSGLKPLIAFARKLKPYLRGILASARFPLNTSVLEGINNKIKVIKRMAYGYRDTEYFFLKIKYAFPGIRR
ncbi:MAG: transposase for insertion sequence element [Puniceicoccaceae bacterium 5H]|nr:MAG: transposase for insertion sequence element [Puniceicoccaceae bacterium 5H]